MGIQQKLHTKLVQKLILTPSLQQAIKLLPMSTLELSDLLNQEMVENPMLEEVPTEELQPAEAAPAAEKTEPAQQANKTDTWDDQDYEYFFGDYLDDGYRPRAPQEVKELPPIENTLSTSSSLSDHLMWQLSMQTDDSVMREIGSAIVGNLDDDGYLVASFDELAGMGPWPVTEVERALRLVQGFDPTGVAARDLQECLLLQLRHLGPRGDADREDRHRPPPPAAEPSGARDRAQARADDRRPERAHRDHPPPRSRSQAAATTRRSRSTSFPTFTW